MPEDNEPSEMTDSDYGAETPEIKFCFPENDEKILAPNLTAFESGSLTPLIKEELRFTIQSRRLAAGKGMLKLEEFKKPQKKKPMTDEEKKRAQVRRSQNREAAQRFRQRQKDQTCYLSDKIKRLERTSTSLQNEIKRLRIERDELSIMLQEHLVVCTKRPPLPEITCSTIDHLLQQISNPPTNVTDFSLATPHCPDTSDSTSSVFFQDELNCNQKTGVIYDNFLGLETDTLEMFEDNGSMMQDLEESPEITQERVTGGNDISDSEYSDDPKLDSCSSLETVSNYSSVSSENFFTVDTTIELSSTLAASYSMVEMNAFYCQPFETAITTDDILLLDNTS